MTGLERWAQQNATTATEVTMLIMASGMNPIEILGDSMDSDTALSSGRATALEGLLKRGRSGELRLTPETFADVAQTDVETVTEIINANPAMFEMHAERDDITDPIKSISSAAFEQLLNRINGKNEPADAPANEPDANTEPETTPDANEQPQGVGEENTPEPSYAGGNPKKTANKNKIAEKPAKPAQPRKKTKYSINKNTAAELLKPAENDMAIREIRMFLLSLPEYKPADVALMSDQEIMDIVSKNFVRVQLGAGTVFMPTESYQSLINVLTANEAYYIPNAAPQDDTQE